MGINLLTPDLILQAESQLSAADPVLARLIADYSPCEMSQWNLEPFPCLVNSIISQMISYKAAEAVEKLWRALNHPDTLANLAYAAKSYGAGALKAEPRQLDTLLIPLQVLEAVGLRPPFRGQESKTGRRRHRA